MHIGLMSGARGAIVERLHRVLQAIGFGVHADERQRAEFGPSTTAALKGLQAQHGLPAEGDIDERTLSVLLEAERININIVEVDEGGSSSPAAPPPHEGDGDGDGDDRLGSVHGRVVDGDGAAVPHLHLMLFARRVRGETQLAHTHADAQGRYRMAYHRPRALNLLVRALAHDESKLAESSVVFAAPPDVQIDLSTAADGIVRAPSAYTVLVGQVSAQLHGTPLQDLVEDRKTHDLQFLADASGARYADVAQLYVARRLGPREGLQETTLFGIFSQGIPAALGNALADLPDAGIDDSFLSQVLAGVLAHGNATLAATLTAALAASVLPPSTAALQAAELAKLDALRVQSAGATPYIRGKTPLVSLLAAGQVDSTASSTFISAFAAAGGRLGPTWKAIRAAKSLSAAQIKTLNTTLSVGELLTGNLPLVQDTLQRLASSALSGVRDLALLDSADWVARITALDPQADSIPKVLPDDTPAQRIARFAASLAQRFGRRFPTTAFAGGLAKAESSSFHARDELVAVLKAQPKLDLTRSNIDQFVRTNQLQLSAAALAQLKTAQRLHRVAPQYTAVEALHGGGYSSAQSVYFKGRAPFVAHMAQPLGGAAQADAAWVRAQVSYAGALAAFGRFHLALNGVQFAVMASAVPAPETLANLPDLQALFGSLDFCACSDCRSVISPGAYLVDLLQFLKQRAAGGGFANARDVLLARRADIPFIALGCENTDVTLPTIDIVNELLEAAIAPPATPPTLIVTTGASDERRALPQQVSAAAYALTASAVFPLGLPFDLAFAQTRAFLAALGSPLAQVMALAGSGTPFARAAAQLGLNPAMLALIDGSDAHAPWQRWGFASANPVGVIDPKTRLPFTPADWIAALNIVPVLLARSALTLDQLYQLLEARWVTQGTLTLQPGFKGEGDTQVVSCDTEAMRFTGLDAPALDRINRFLRLWVATALPMWELDWALALSPGGLLDDAFVTFIADVVSLRDALGLPLPELLGFWGPLTTRDVTNHLGDEDAVQPSPYSSVFRNPTMLAAWGSVFVDAAALPGSAIVVPAEPPPTAAQLANLNAIKAALGLSADDVAAVLAASGAANALTLDTLNVLLRHARLAAALALPVADLLLWITLTDGQPFGGAPADTAEFLRRLAQLKGSGIALHDLDYLLRHGSATKSAMAFTLAQITAVLQAVRNALAKLSPAALADAPTVQTIFVDALADATRVSADVVVPVLARSGVLPLPAGTVALLLAQTSGVDPTQFPPLVAAFTRVAKAAALFGALQPGVTEFVFLVDNASAYNWIDPSLLPLATPLTASYVGCERLLQALGLNRRQSARTPKLFDVLGAWIGALPPDVATAISGSDGALAQAMNASVSDLTTLAVARGATAPSLTAGTQPGSLADMALLSALAAALDAALRFHIGAATHVQLAASPPTADSAAAAFGVFQAQFSPNAWFAAVQPVEDLLRQARRDALVAYLVGQGPAVPINPPLLSSDDIFQQFLIDPEMAPCGITTRLLQASLAVQQFVQQCFLNLVPQVSVNATTDAGWNEWAWMKQFRLWQANREVFLYPENYLLPELRSDKSPFFAELENDLKQADCNADAATAAFENYLRKLVEVSSLVVKAHYQETRPDGSRVLHVFARTRGTPPKWYYRTRAEGSFGSGLWSPWRVLHLDIQSEHLLPVVWDQRLHLLWPVFKALTAKAAEQSNPTGGTASPADSLWVVDFAMSELSAGQWQAKRTIHEKMFFSYGTIGGESPQAYTFRAFEDPLFNLQLQGYVALWGVSDLMARAALPMPDAPLAVVEDKSVLPSPKQVDIAQEPSYSLVTTADFYSPIQSLARPWGYEFSAQELVYGNYRAPGTGAAPLNVLVAASAKTPPASVQLLGRITAPRIVVPMQEPVFDSVDPFFVSEPARSWFVQPHFYTVSSSPQELDNPPYNLPWGTRFAFAAFYHPFARTFLRELEIGGADRLMQRNLQLNPLQVRGQGGFDFGVLYQPQPPVAQPYPVEDVDFSVDGAYAGYNWEVFYHVPMLVATRLMANQQYATAMQWLEYVFNPTDPSPAPVPGHYWNMAPFYAMNANDWLAQQIQVILTTLAVDQQQGISDPATAAAIQDWLAHPFDPHRVARLRIGAYAKATVMKFLDNLIAWGDSLYAQYTMEDVAQAEQLYVFADLILGPPPDRVRLPAADQPNSPDATTYSDIAPLLDEFSNALVAIENVVSVPSAAAQLPDAMAQAPALPQMAVAATAETLFFCIPPNQQLLAYWGTVADRLYKIRHCLNLQGVAQPLPLYAPPINPMQLVGQAAGGSSAFGTPAFTPVYRFATYLDRAVELTNDVRAYGALVLAALEKQDAEALVALRANQELDIQTRTLDLKNQAVAEAQAQIVALQNQKAVVQVRRDFYAGVAFMNDWEKAAIGLQLAAMIINGVAIVLDLTSGVANALPSVMFGAAGFGGSPLVVTTYGGQQVGSAASSFATVSRGLAGLLSEAGGMASTMGGYQRRMDDWAMQARQATAELTQLDSQIAAAQQRVTMATSEVDLQTRQIANAQAVSDFLTSKYSNAELYDWMLTRLTGVHTQAYQLAFSLAQQAQAAYQYELGNADGFIQFGYWDSQHKGLTAGESLLFDLRRMQSQYLAANTRELELVKHVSLALTQPMALVQLLQTGSCNIALDEALFDRDHPGHYFRRLRSMALTVPCVSGPYTGVNATLVLDTAIVRVQAPSLGYVPALATAPPGGPAFITSQAPASASIRTSQGQNDAGLFDVNLRDERWLPFEGQGAVSTWTLVLDPRDNGFDFSTITDVVLHLRYTARSTGGNPEAVRQALKPLGARQIMLSVRNSFGNAYFAFFNPTDSNASAQALALPLAANVFPFSNLGAVAITDISIFLVLPSAPAAGTSIAASFGADGAGANAISIVQVPGNTGAGASIAALGGDAGLTAAVPPGPFTLTVPETSVPAALGVPRDGHLRLDEAKFEDIVLVIDYRMA